jgi:hypothetical protein
MFFIVLTDFSFIVKPWSLYFFDHQLFTL